jgi:hypothetical protein
MKKLLFLDLDGVLNIEQGAKATHLKKSEGLISLYFEQHLVKRLNKLFEIHPDIDVVMSSSWRVGEFLFALEELKNLGANFHEKFVGATPVIKGGMYSSCYSNNRGEEILSYLKDNFGENFNDSVKWIAIDDVATGLIDSGLVLIPENNAVITDPFKGIQADDVNKLINFFKKD